MPLVDIRCPYDGKPLEVSLEFLGDPPMFNLATSPGFVEHMNAEHGARLHPVEVWPPVLSEVSG